MTLFSWAQAVSWHRTASAPACKYRSLHLASAHPVERSELRQWAKGVTQGVT